jgi:peptidoglycan/LPS O-acetylase OafA/YrhL
MSGILVTYVHMKYLEKFSIKLHWFYLFRLLRLVPALAATILISISVVKYVTEGPIWHAVLKQHLTNCKETWWSTLLFVNNFIKYDDMVSGTWGTVWPKQIDSASISPGTCQWTPNCTQWRL